jgi:hypothetical protein
MRQALSVIVLVINIAVGFHALLSGSYFIVAACTLFGTMCFIDLKEGI